MRRGDWGAEGVMVVDDEGADTVPAFDVEAVDTTGCGDAFSAGFLRGLSLGRDRRDAAVLGCAAAALVAPTMATTTSSRSSSWPSAHDPEPSRSGYGTGSLLDALERELDRELSS
jgi:bifunctional ADP-heptose synthase (sugar kinase/adenylyltransferase)